MVMTGHSSVAVQGDYSFGPGKPTGSCREAACGGLATFGQPEGRVVFAIGHPRNRLR